MIHGLLPVLTGAILTLNTTTCSLPQPTPNDTLGFQIEEPRIQTCVYTVQQGESVTTIAAKFYTNEDYWTTLWNDNPKIEDPTQIEVGTKLIVRLVRPSKVEDLKPELAKRSETSAPQLVYSTQTYNLAAVQTPTSAPAAQPSSYDAVYQAAGAKYGVPWQILYGLHMAETGGRNGPINSHGPEGPMQFMPGTFAAYHDPDYTNIDDATDAIYAAARYLSMHGSVQNGLVSYGTNISAVRNAAASRGYTGI